MNILSLPDALLTVATAELETLTLGSGATVVINPVTGDIVQELDSPDDTAEILEIADYLGRRRAYAHARIAGLKAERDAMVNEANEKYGPQIKAEERYVEYLESRWYEPLRIFAQGALHGKRTKSHRIGLLVLKFGTTRASTKITDAEKAVNWASDNCPEAIKMQVLVSDIPADAKVYLTPEISETTGLVFYPGGEETFEVK